MARSYCWVIVVGISAALTGCAILAKEPVPISERPPISETPPISERPPAEPPRSQTVVALAKRHVGAPYRWGGPSPPGFGCSGPVRYLYPPGGVVLPHHAPPPSRLRAAVPPPRPQPGGPVLFGRPRHHR